MLIIEHILKGELETGGNDLITDRKRLTSQGPPWGITGREAGRAYSGDGAQVRRIPGSRVGWSQKAGTDNSEMERINNLCLGGRKTGAGLVWLSEKWAGRRHCSALVLVAQALLLIPRIGFLLLQIQGNTEGLPYGSGGQLASLSGWPAAGWAACPEALRRESLSLPFPASRGNYMPRLIAPESGILNLVTSAGPRAAIPFPLHVTSSFPPPPPTPSLLGTKHDWAWKRERERRRSGFPFPLSSPPVVLCHHRIAADTRSLISVNVKAFLCIFSICHVFRRSCYKRFS